MILRSAIIAVLFLTIVAFAALVQAIEVPNAKASSPSESCSGSTHGTNGDPTSEDEGSILAMLQPTRELWAHTVHRLTEPYCFDVTTLIPRQSCDWERYEHADGAGSSLRWNCRPGRPLEVNWTRCVDRNVNHYLHFVALPTPNSFQMAISSTIA